MCIRDRVSTQSTGGGFSVTMGIYIDVSEFPDNGYGMVQLLFLLVVYGIILFVASNLIGDGAELLLLVPSISGIVGSIVLPVLGAVPDGALVLFSGLGSDAQDKMNVGVGALAGSTVMLLTIPWLLSIIAGRVDLDDNGQPKYQKPKGVSKADWRKCSHDGIFQGMTETGVFVGPQLKNAAKQMMLTSLLMLVIQIPAFFYSDSDVDSSNDVVKAKAMSDEADNEKPWIFTTMVLCFMCFVGYLVIQYRHGHSSSEERKSQITIKHIHLGTISLRGAFADELRKLSEDKMLQTAMSRLPQMGSDDIQVHLDNDGKCTDPVDLSISRTSIGTPKGNHVYSQRMRDTVKPFFMKHDADKSGALDMLEVQQLFQELNEKLDNTQLAAIFAGFDEDGNGVVDFEEFVIGCARLVLSVQTSDEVRPSPKHEDPEQPKGVKNDEDEEDPEEEEEDEPEIPEDLVELSPEEQQTRIKRRAGWMLVVGTALLLFFSDPTSDALDELGNRLHLSLIHISEPTRPY
eukprot:TRINITY_DN10741_c0_g2_i1.p1 TRINITY_DN10741_c0_g2~~TRINITY_DN10741_c0_g2_i1.p1  ORF type:complete len:516 (-),score=129.36 TRINITY_DN10741_c0_g2_i1:27-1574(-)